MLRDLMCFLHAKGHPRPALWRVILLRLRVILLCIGEPHPVQHRPLLVKMASKQLFQTWAAHACHEHGYLPMICRVYHCVCEWKYLPSRWDLRSHILKKSGCGVRPPRNCDQEASIYIQDSPKWVTGGLLQQEPRWLCLYRHVRWTRQLEGQIAFLPIACRL